MSERPLGYREATYRLAGDLQLLAEIARRHAEEPLAAELDSVRSRIESRRFMLAVVGEFKRGKSTFINALMGREILPADVLPTSATINRVTYGLVPSATLHFRDDRPPERLDLEDPSALAAHVTKWTEETAARAATIREAVVTYPLPLCRNDIDIVDTPGLSDDSAMTDVTSSLLPNIDAAIVVLMADSPFSSSEASLVERLVRQGVGRIWFVVNAIDRIRKVEDRARIVESIRARIRATGLLQGEPALYPLSGLLALEARQSGDDSLLQDSGMTALEDILMRELLRSDGTALVRRLHQTLDRCADLGRALQAAELRSAAAPSGQPHLGALLLAAERALARTKARWESAVESILEACRPKLDAWPKTAERIAGAAISRHKAKIVAGWLDRRQEILLDLASDIAASLAAKLEEELSALAVPDLGPALAELSRAATSLDTLLPFVSLAIHQVPPPPPQDGLRGLSMLPLGAWPREPLLVDAPALLRALDSPQIAQLGKGIEKLDFLSKKMAEYNLPGQFAKLAVSALGAAMAQRWESDPPQRWLERWQQEGARPAREAITSAERAVRALQGAVTAASERASVRAERDRQEIEGERARIREISERSESLLGELRAFGF